MEKLVTCQVKSEHIAGIAGKTFSYYGHMFRIEESGKTAVCNIAEHIALEEQRLGRYKIIGPTVPDSKPEPVKPEPVKIQTGISKDAIVLTNYYGCGDLENFRKKIATMDRNELSKYASETVNVEIAPGSYTKKMVDQLCMIVETKVAEALAAAKQAPISKPPAPPVAPVTEAKTAEALAIK